MIVVPGSDGGLEHAGKHAHFLADNGVPALAVALFKTKHTGKNCWSQNGESLPYTPYKMRKFNMLKLIWRAKEFNILETNTGKKVVPQSVIPIEKLKIPIMMFSTKVDTIWPSTESCEIMCKKLEENQYPYPYKHIAFEHMSHMMLEYCGKVIKYFIKSEKSDPEACYAERDVMGQETIKWIEDIWN